MRRKKTMGSQAGIPAAAGFERAVLNTLGDGRGILNSPGFLRLESLLGNTQSVDFNMIVNQGKTTVTENRLQITDTFVATQLGFFVFRVPTGQTTTKGKLLTWGNPLIFTKVGEADNIDALWQDGKLQIVKNSIENVPAMDIQRLRSVGVAQQGVVPGPVNAYQADERRDAKTGFMRLTPILSFQGADKVQIKLTLPESLDLTGTGYDNYAVLYFRGFLRQNASFIGKKNRIK